MEGKDGGGEEMEEMQENNGGEEGWKRGGVPQKISIHVQLHTTAYYCILLHTITYYCILLHTTYTTAYYCTLYANQASQPHGL